MREQYYLMTRHSKIYCNCGRTQEPVHFYMTSSYALYNRQRAYSIRDYTGIRDSSTVLNIATIRNSIHLFMHASEIKIEYSLLCVQCNDVNAFF